MSSELGITRRSTGSLSFDDLIRPMTTAAFIEYHLLRQVHHLSLPNEVLVGILTSIPELCELERLVGLCPRVTLFGPDGFRSTVSNAVAMDFYRRGDTLYLTGLERRIPKVGALFEPVARTLGIDPRAISIEAFAGRQRAMSSLHYDHDTNFQILLRGQKVWRLQPNRHIRNPLRPHHDLGSPRDEALAEQRPLPLGLTDLDDVIEVHATPGTCLFFPMGYWHEVETAENSFAVNLVLKPPRWIDVICSGVRQRLISRTILRAHAFGALSHDDGALARHACNVFAAGVADYKEALDAVTPEEGAWAVNANLMRWTAKARTRVLDEASGGMRLVCLEGSLQPFDVPCELQSMMQKAVAFRGLFTLGNLKTIAPAVPLRTLNTAVQYLVMLSYIEDAGISAATDPH